MQSKESKLMSYPSIYQKSEEYECAHNILFGYCIEEWESEDGIVIGYIATTIKDGRVRKEYWKYA